MRVLGAILAGGQARRFGSDKALATLGGKTLIDRVAAALAGQVDAVVICGRAGGLPDRPRAGLGPLGGLNAALHEGAARGFDAVLSVPCDTSRLPTDLLDRLRRAGDRAYIKDAPVVGLWRCALAPTLDSHIVGDDRSLRAWARRVEAIAVSLDVPIENINTPADLARLVNEEDRPRRLDVADARSDSGIGIERRAP
ncbi:MAG: molybdenum cofactor guanylyltransferase [Sphingomonadaceae bacterium]|nr:molybdenum cofactor guanylyltransferase [Sphingomonadaceae bacterium]